MNTSNKHKNNINNTNRSFQTKEPSTKSQLKDKEKSSFLQQPARSTSLSRAEPCVIPNEKQPMTQEQEPWMQRYTTWTFTHVHPLIHAIIEKILQQETHHQHLSQYRDFILQCPTITRYIRLVVDTFLHTSPNTYTNIYTNP